MGYTFSTGSAITAGSMQHYRSLQQTPAASCRWPCFCWWTYLRLSYLSITWSNETLYIPFVCIGFFSSVVTIPLTLRYVSTFHVTFHRPDDTYRRVVSSRSIYHLVVTIPLTLRRVVSSRLTDNIQVVSAPPHDELYRVYYRLVLFDPIKWKKSDSETEHVDREFEHVDIVDHHRKLWNYIY